MNFAERTFLMPILELPRSPVTTSRARLFFTNITSKPLPTSGSPSPQRLKSDVAKSWRFLPPVTSSSVTTVISTP